MNTIHPDPVPQLSGLQLLALAMRLANRAVLSDIECNALRVDLDGNLYYDVRPMLDPREQPDEAIDMAAEAIDYALDSGLVASHPVHKHYLRIVCRAARLSESTPGLPQ